MQTMQTITTKFIGPTNTKGSRIKATCWLGNVTISWDYSLDVEANHHAAVSELVEKLNRKRISENSWSTVGIADSVDGKGYTALIDLV